MKRSPIKRGLKRLIRKTRLRRFGRRHQREADAMAHFRTEVLARAGGLCESCWMAPATDAHHICSRARGAGHKMLHDPRNGFALCRTCHDAIHRDPNHPWIDGPNYLDLLERNPTRKRR